MVERKNPIRNYLGDSPYIKVLDTLLKNPNSDYSKRELAEAAEISPPTLYKIWNGLEENNLIEETRKIGNATLYKLNGESKLVEELERFNRRLLQHESRPSKKATRFDARLGEILKHRRDMLVELG